jgi:peptide/nickel transport system ATP-binding protein
LLKSKNDPLLEVKELQTHFFTSAGVVKAVDGVSFKVSRGEVLGLVGESGSGKTVTGFSILGLVDYPGRIVAGSIEFNGLDISQTSPEQLRNIRGNRIAMIFQDPMMTLNPLLRIDTQMIETIQAHDNVSSKDARRRSVEALDRVGIAAPEKRLLSYPHQLSGGMRQRVAIAIALLNKPDLIIADEATTALDVSIQDQILAVVQNLCTSTGMALIWITHDLSVVAGLADNLCVMYAGRIVESGTVAQVIDTPGHPYTLGLLNSVPARNKRNMPLKQIPGMSPNPVLLPPGCSFEPRCSMASQGCLKPPPLVRIGTEHNVECHYPINHKK